jgi:hypothetical protein
MPEVNVPSDPIIVYGMVGLFVVAIVLAFFFSRSRRGLGPATRADAAKVPPDQVWMPGGDIFGREPAAPPPPPAPVEPAFSDPLTGPLDYPPTDSPIGQPAAHDPWSTTADPSGQQPRWDRR